MIKEIKKITNNNVDFLNLQENHLSIQLSLDGFSFCIYNKISAEIGVFAVYEFQNTPNPYKHLELVEQLYQQEILLHIKYESISVVHLNNLVTQVPQPIFDKNQLKNYLNYSIKVLENDFICYDEIPNSDIVNVYIPFVNINNFLIDKYGSFNYKHSSTVLIEQLIHQHKNIDDTICFVNVSKNNFEIVVLKNKKLQLYNSFNFETKEDFIYYILFTAEQLNLNPEELTMVLLGEINEELELYTLLYKYIRNIKFYKPVNFSSILEKEISLHSHFTLLNQHYN